MEEVEERSDDGERRDSTEPRRATPFPVLAFSAETEALGGGLGSYPGCSTPSSHIGSVHLSGVASLSRR